MVKKMETLSDKRGFTDYDGVFVKGDNGDEEGDLYLGEDVREFIKQLKDNIGNCHECGSCLTEEKIDKLAGQRLVGGVQDD